MRDHLKRHRTILTRLADAMAPGAIVSGATAGTTGWLLSLLLHHL
ncbi:hypothetical protein GCM10009527_014350 [Actinomadura nitritigenes]|nr:hypothetical protein [Actinomadura nitritigenes]